VASAYAASSRRLLILGYNALLMSSSQPPTATAAANQPKHRDRACSVRSASAELHGFAGGPLARRRPQGAILRLIDACILLPGPQAPTYWLASQPACLPDGLRAWQPV
jgi:hypothetical protein